MKRVPSKPKNTSRKWFDYAFEFIIIFASLYLTFELEDYGEYKNNREKEEVYLVSLHEDLNKDIEQLNRRILEYENKLSDLTRLFQLLENYDENTESIRELYLRHLNYTFLYSPVNNTFESLKSGGDIKLIENQNFKILLSELDKSYKTTISSGQALKEFREGDFWNNTIITSINTSNFNRIGENPDFEIIMQNLLTIYIRHAEAYFFFLQGSLEKSKEARDLLSGELLYRGLIDEKPTKVTSEDIFEEFNK